NVRNVSRTTMVQGTEPLPTPEIRISLGSKGVEEILVGTLCGVSTGPEASAALVLVVNGGITGGSGDVAAANRFPVPVMTSNSAASLAKRCTLLMPGSSPGHNFLSVLPRMRRAFP